MAIGAGADSEHDRLYREASAIVYPLLRIDGAPLVKMTPEVDADLRRGLGLLERVVQINPHNWAAMWMIGKAWQRLQDFAQALAWFTRGHEVNPVQPDIAREAAIAAMELGQPETALPFCENAIAAKPHDPGLHANLALALLFIGDVDRATAVATEALARDPSDKITQRIVTVCREVQSGKRPRPHHVRDLT